MAKNQVKGGVKESEPEPERKAGGGKRVGTFMPLSAAQLKHPLTTVPSKLEESPIFSAGALTRTSVGKVMQFSKPQNGVLKAYGVPKNLVVEFRVLSSPYSVVRDVTISTAELLEAASSKPSSETRAVITGQAGSGKSFLLLQSVEYCVSKGWIVLYVPRAINLVNSSTPHVYDERTRTYLQPEFTFELLRRFEQVNASAMKQIQITRPFAKGNKKLASGAQLSELIKLGTSDKTLAPAVFDAVLHEVARQTQRPVLLAVDDFQALYCKTIYRDTQFQGIKSYHLSLPRVLLEYAGGMHNFAKGAVLGAISNSSTEYQPCVELREALGLSHPLPVSPYLRRSPELVAYAKGLRNIAVPDTFQVSEAAALFNLWGQDHALHHRPTDEVFLTMFTAASGNPRNFVWREMLSSLSLSP